MHVAPGLISPSREGCEMRFAVDALEKVQAGRPSTGTEVDATWKLLWSTEKARCMYSRRSWMHNQDAAQGQQEKG